MYCLHRLHISARPSPPLQCNLRGSMGIKSSQSDEEAKRRREEEVFEMNERNERSSRAAENSPEPPLLGEELLQSTPRREAPAAEAALSYRSFGDGPPILFIMGFLARSDAWRQQIISLSERWRCIIFDNRGVGESADARPAASMQELAEDALAVLNHAGCARAHIVGISMGGMIAQRLTLMAPERVQSLALLVTHPGGFFRALPPLRSWPDFLRARLHPHRR